MEIQLAKINQVDKIKQIYAKTKKFMDNLKTAKTILKNRFTYCDIIKKEDGSERLAYQHV